MVGWPGAGLPGVPNVNNSPSSAEILRAAETVERGCFGSCPIELVLVERRMPLDVFTGKDAVLMMLARTIGIRLKNLSNF